MIEGTIKAVCASVGKGTAKLPLDRAEIKTQWGIEGDAHAGSWHRQISLLSYGKVEEFRRRGADAPDGAFGENLLVNGIDFPTLPIGTVCVTGDVVLEITQIGKQCHAGCDIFTRMGSCIMPTEGVFARVLHGGTVTPGEKMQAWQGMRVFIICASDRCFRGEQSDEGTPVLVKLAKEAGYEISGTCLLPDDRTLLADKMAKVCDGCLAELLLTTGGTGLSLRDVTPEATLDIAQRQVPGLAEMMRMKCFALTSRASLSRGVCATRNRTLIVNLPGNPKAAVENLEVILEPLEHGLELLTGRASECASTLRIQRGGENEENEKNGDRTSGTRTVRGNSIRTGCG